MNIAIIGVMAAAIVLLAAGCFIGPTRRTKAAATKVAAASAITAPAPKASTMQEERLAVITSTSQVKFGGRDSDCEIPLWVDSDRQRSATRCVQCPDSSPMARHFRKSLIWKIADPQRMRRIRALPPWPLAAQAANGQKRPSKS